MKSRASFENKVLPWLLLTPALALIGGLVLYPVARTFWLSFRNAGLRYLRSGESTFVGLDNYADMWRNDQLRQSFVTTAVFGFACVAATMALGLAVALLLHQRFRGRALLGVLVLLPWAIPRVAAGIVWKWLFDDQYGLVNWVLPGEDRAWLVESRLTAFFAIGIVVVWQSFPFVALALLAGLSSIPNELREAAWVDGAKPWQVLRSITLPMLKPLLLTLVVVSTIWDFKVFDQVYAMTEGGPARSTEVVAVTVYREFAKSNLGTAAAMAFALFAVLSVLTLLYTRMARERDDVTTQAAVRP